MTDLHCHILPQMDDGARNVETSIELLNIEKNQGVKNLIFTSHFHCDDEPVDSYIARRADAVKNLASACPSELINHFQFKFGAEVYFSPELCNIDLAPLCFTDTSYLLVELPFTMSLRPQFLSETLYEISCSGITPIIAHVERYPYILEDLTQIYDWVEAGYMVQTNAATLVRGDKMSALMMKLIKWDLVHLVATDTHSLHKRPPQLDAALAAVSNKLGDAAASRLIQNGDLVFDNYEIDINPYCPRKVLGTWK